MHFEGSHKNTECLTIALQKYNLCSALKQVTIFISFGQTLLYDILRAWEGGILFSHVPNPVLPVLPSKNYTESAHLSKKIVMNEILAVLRMVL